jgi:hypothetical protein
MTVEGAALAFEILSTGISEMSKGDLHYTGPTGDVGVRAPGLPDRVRNGLRTRTEDKDVFSYRRDSNAGIELVNVKLRCYAQWNGPEVAASIIFPADGMRSRLMNDTHVTVSNPLSLETLTAPASWRDIGVPLYPVVRVPISIYVDHPWPADNYKVSFLLVLSGMYGFGADGLNVYEDYEAHWD